MASIWLEPIVHENPGFHVDCIKLRRPLEVVQLRVDFSSVGVSYLELFAKNLRRPGEALVSVKKAESVQGDALLTLTEPVLTNYLLVKGEYQTLKLCLEATEPTLRHEKISVRPVNTKTDLATSCASRRSPGALAWTNRLLARGLRRRALD
jgi:hypothetical protein